MIANLVKMVGKIRFSDREFQRNGRDSVYYVRAIEEPSLRVNGDNLRWSMMIREIVLKSTSVMAATSLIKKDDCVSLSEERAWSSPIYVNKI